MAYNLELGDRIRRGLALRMDVTEKKMFGGLAFMVRGHMACGVIGDGLMLRVDPEREPELLQRPGARPMDFTGRRMKGFLQVDPGGIADDETLAGWLAEATARAEGLPAK
jgi:hypothetical protein